MTALVFTVSGVPATQGNHRASLRGGHAHLYDASRGLTAWKRAVRLAASIAARAVGGNDWTPLEGPISLGVTFILPRVRVTKTGKLLRWKGSAPVAQGTGDLDKLIRAVGDALTGIAYRDDSQIVYLVADKAWALDDEPACARITVRRDTDER